MNRSQQVWASTKSVSNIVTIQQVGSASSLHEKLIEAIGNAALAGRAQAGEPDHTSTMPVELGPLLRRYRRLMPYDLRGLIHRCGLFFACWHAQQFSDASFEFATANVNVRHVPLSIDDQNKGDSDDP